MTSKLLALLVCALFGLAFIAGGIFGGLLPLAEITTNAWSARSWQPVPGTILAVDREVHGKGSSTTEVRYGYEVAGQRYESGRIGLARPGGDSIGRWQEEWYQRLRAAHGERTPVTVWVDPARPHRAVLDRNIRWPVVVFHLPFALLFTAIGAVALYAFCRVLVTPAGAPAPPPRPSTGRVEGSALWTMAIFWSALSWPMAALVWMEPQPWTPRLLVSLFAVIGLWLLWKAWSGASFRASTD